MNKDHSPRILALGIVLAVIGMIFAVTYARADSFNDRFMAATPNSGVLNPLADPSQSDTLNPPAQDDKETLPAGPWSIKLLLIINGRVARAVPYNEETFQTGEACRNAVMADTKLYADVKEAEKAVAEKSGGMASVNVACAMHLD